MTPDSSMNMGESVVGNSLANEYADAVGANSGPGGLPPDHQVCACMYLYVFCMCVCTRAYEKDENRLISHLPPLDPPGRELHAAARGQDIRFLAKVCIDVCMHVSALHSGCSTFLLFSESGFPSSQRSLYRDRICTLAA
jgi:hypothetical protein